MLWFLFLTANHCGLAIAHALEGLHIPKLLGGRHLLPQLQARQQDLASRPWTKSGGYTSDPKSLTRARAPRGTSRRSNGDGRCGPGHGSCEEGWCCSAAGWCGVTADYCTSPDCQINYGPACDGNQKPVGADTSSIPRAHLGNILYGGVGISDCKRQGDIAITFDDGPYKYTEDLLDNLSAYGAKATFFVTGNNLGKGMINDPYRPWSEYIKRMVAEGHQVASHTWSHQNASQLSKEQFTDQILWNEIALNDILGFIPTYMRPPYSICNKTCQDVLSSLGYHIVYFDLDTEGYLHDDRSAIQTSKNIWDKALNPPASPHRNAFLDVEHDIHFQTVYNLTDYMLKSLYSAGYRAVTVGECVGDPPENWYRAGSGPVPTYPQSVSGNQPASTARGMNIAAATSTAGTAAGP